MAGWGARVSGWSPRAPEPLGTLAGVRHTCERIGCGLDVAVVYGTVPGRDGSLTLWIDAFRPDGSGALERETMGYVCRMHGERLAPPRGWLVDDRRESAPRLFRPQPNLAVVREKAPRSRQDKVRDLPRPSLFTENSASVEAVQPVVETPLVPVPVPVPVPDPVVETPLVPVPVSVPEPEPEPMPEPVVDESPVRGVHVVTGPEPSVDPSGDATRAWEPFFDPDDDLDGMLNATGSMLRDAFRSRHNGRRNG